MSRVTTTNYGAEATTQFAWATTDADFFDREADLYHLAKAVELHDHGSGRGLEVARVAANAVGTAGLQALSVTEAKIGNLAVTNGKLAAGAVARDKVTWPLIQPTNDMAGGYRQRDTSNTYALGFYMAANGLAVFGSGTTATINGSLILGQAGQVSIGAAQGAAKLNIMQVGNTTGAGFRVYNPNTAYYTEVFNDASGYGVITSNGVVNMFLSPSGQVSVGTTANFTSLFNIHQTVAGQGLRLQFSSGAGAIYINASNHMEIITPNTNIMWHYNIAAMTPSTDQGSYLGLATHRWALLYAMSAQFAGAISGVTNITMSGTLTGVTNVSSAGVTFSGTITAVGATLSGTLNTSILNVTGSLTTASGILLCSTHLYPNATGENRNLGALSNKWNELYCQVGYNNSGAWSTYSDDSVKVKSSFQPYTLGLQAIMAMEPIRFRYNGDFGTQPDVEHIGMRAQAVEGIAPEMVGKIHGRRKSGSKDEEEILTFLPGLLVYPLVNAVKELKAEIDELRKLLNDRRN